MELGMSQEVSCLFVLIIIK